MPPINLHLGINNVIRNSKIQGGTPALTARTAAMQALGTSMKRLGRASGSAVGPQNLVRVAMAAGPVLLGCLPAASLYAQNANQQGDLTTFALTNPAATPLQRNAAIAVQGMCRDLKVSGVALTAATPSGDLFRRCNELIQTARGFVPNPVAVPNGRSLGISQAQLLDSVQQVSGEEVSTRGDLATQVSQGQFANISGRLSALRLGSFTFLSHQVADARS